MANSEECLGRRRSVETDGGFRRRLHDNEAVREVEQRVPGVRDHHRGLTLILATSHRLNDVVASLSIDAGGGLIQHGKCGIADERSGEKRPTLLSARELIHRSSAHVPQTHAAQSRVHASFPTRQRPRTNKAGGHELRDRNGDAVQVRNVLGRISNSTPRSHRSHVNAQEVHGSSNRGNEPHHRFHEGGLAAAVHAEYHNARTPRNIKAYVFEDYYVPKRNGDVPERASARHTRSRGAAWQGSRA